jgi:rod shape-determining protein MreC
MAVTGRNLRRRYVLLLLVLTGVTLVTLDQRSEDSGPIGAVGSAVHEVVAPVQRATEAVVSPIADWLDGVTSGSSLKEENEQLRRELAETAGRLGQAEDAIERARQLSEILDLPYVEGIPRITAPIISPPPGNFEDTVVIGKGESDGIRTGMPVVAAGGLFGRVVEVSRSQAKVMRITDESFSVSVRSARDRFVGIASGNGSRTLDLEFVGGVEGDPILVGGDALVTSGADASRFPGGLPVGEISEVDVESSTSLRTGEVEPYVALGAVEVVQVLDWDPVRDEQPLTTDDGDE